MTATDEERPRSAWQLLRDPRFGRFFAGSLASNTGTWCQDIAAAIFVFQVTGLASLVAVVAVAGFGTAVVLAPLGGQLADRFDRRRLLIVSMSCLALISSVFAVLVLLGVKEVWLVVAVSLALGAGRAINNPAMQAIIPAIVPPRDFAQAAALSAVTFNAARAVGPALGALLIAFAGAGAAFAANALSFVFFTLVLVSLRTASASRPHTTGGLFGGLRYVRHHPDLILLLVMAAVAGFATDPVITLGPSLAKHLGEKTEFAGWFVSAFGIGAMAVAPFVGRVRRQLGPMRSTAYGFAGITVAFAIAGFASNLAVAIVGLAMAGVFYLVITSDISASLLERLDDTVRGRVMALWSVGFHGSRPIAALIDGNVSDATSPQVAVIVMACIMAVAATLIALSLRVVSRSRLP